MILDTKRFPEATLLEGSADAIRSEYERVFAAYFMGYDGRFQLWPQERIYSRGWNVFPLFEDTDGEVASEVSENCELVPDTVAILRQVPGLRSARYSLLLPGGYVRPHVAEDPSVVQCHLALVVPHRSAMRIAGRLHQWEAGVCALFDGRLVREWWNYSDEPRVVLHLDLDRKPFEGEQSDDRTSLERLVAAWQRFRASLYRVFGARPSGLVGLPHKVVHKALYAIR